MPKLPEIHCPHCDKELEVMSPGESDCPYCGTYFIVKPDLSVSHVIPYKPSAGQTIVFMVASLLTIAAAAFEFDDRLHTFVICAGGAVFCFGSAVFAYHQGVTTTDSGWLSQRNHPVAFNLMVAAYAIMGVVCLGLIAWEFVVPN